MGRTAGWNIPMGLIHKQTQDCNFSEQVFFVGFLKDIFFTGQLVWKSKHSLCSTVSPQQTSSPLAVPQEQSHLLNSVLRVLELVKNWTKTRNAKLALKSFTTAMVEPSGRVWLLLHLLEAKFVLYLCMPKDSFTFLMLWHQFIFKMINCIICLDPIYCSLNEDELVCYPTDALLAVPVMLPSSNTPLLVNTVMVRHWHQHLSYQRFNPLRNCFFKGIGPSWASNVKSGDYELICPSKTHRVPVTDFASCNLAKVPAHAVVTRPEIRKKVVDILDVQQVSLDFFHHFYLFSVFLIHSSTELQV